MEVAEAPGKAATSEKKKKKLSGVKSRHFGLRVAGLEFKFRV